MATGARLVVALLLAVFLAANTLSAQTPQPTLEQELTTLARALRDSESEVAYNRLSDFAEKHSRDWLGLRASLALGFYDQSKGRYEQALAEFRAAEGDVVLREYAMYLTAESLRALNRDAEALERLELHRRDYPRSLLADQVVQSLAQSAITVAAPEKALAALDGYEKTASRPALVELRAQVLERLKREEDAARSYLALYYQYPLSDEARRANARITDLRASLGDKFPPVSPDLVKTRASALYDARQWQPARTEYARLVTMLSGIDRERAELRAAIAAANTGPNPAPLAELSLTDPELDAERLYELSQEYRSLKQEPGMLAAIEQVLSAHAQSRWAEDALFAAGNYFWVTLDRHRATEFYRRLLEKYPSGRNSLQAHWRFAWAAYLDRQPEAVTLMEEHLRRFPGSPLTENFLYWLGRAAERESNVPHARTFYAKAVERFPHSYFGLQAAARLREINADGPQNASDVPSQTSPPPPLPAFDTPIPKNVAGQWERAQALRGIALDQFAEAELRVVYALAASPRILLEIARAAQDAGHYQPSISAARQLLPQLEARKVEDVPREFWRLVYPLPYEASIERFCSHAKIDPMLVAGLIRQESVFQRDAVSRAGAVGLMQVLPSTGRQLARQLNLPYSRERLTEADYNLQLGTTYFADLLGRQGTLEKALAAFNAGEDRVALWMAERQFAEPAEFVQSIPFTETREYVQIVLRNAELYRRLYGTQP